MTKQPDKPYFIGDSCLGWSFGSGIAPGLSRRVIRSYSLLKESAITGVLDVVPSYNALAVHFDPLQTSADEVAETVTRLLRQAARRGPCAPPTTHAIPVVYDGEDLSRLASARQLTVAEVVRLHTRKLYTVAMIGFRPHFAYLLGLDPRLETPRLASPRPRVPAGSVGIGGNQTGVYPDESPGGWNLIGRAPPALLPAIRIGDRVKFRSVPAL